MPTTNKTAAGKPPTKKAAKSAATAQSAKAITRKKSATRVSARSRPETSAEQRHRDIEVAAYYIAQRRGFAPGREFEDWTAAEAEIDHPVGQRPQVDVTPN